MIAMQVLGSLAVILLPGWLWSLALVPGVGRLERCAVAFGLGLVLVPLGAFWWRELGGLPLGTAGALAYLALLSLAGAVAARWRLRAAAPGDSGPQ